MFNPRRSTAGYLNSQVAGRTDRLPIGVDPDSYVLPADIVSGVGQGNSTAGARLFDEAFKSGPWGTKLPAMKRGMGIPSPPRSTAPKESATAGSMAGLAGALKGMGGLNPTIVTGGDIETLGTPDTVEDTLKRGGKPKSKSKPVSIAAAGGEYVVSPDQVRLIGGGDIKEGHRLLHAMVEQIRKATIKKLRSLPGPKT